MSNPVCAFPPCDNPTMDTTSPLCLGHALQAGLIKAKLDRMTAEERLSHFRALVDRQTHLSEQEREALFVEVCRRYGEGP